MERINENAAFLHADRWGAKWSERGVELRFGDGATGVALALGPEAIASLTAELAHHVQQYEQKYGTLWSENHAQRGANTETEVQWHETGPHAAPAQSLFNWVKNLPLTGFERSFKMSPQLLSPQRFLLGVSARQIDMADVLHVAKQMNFPAEWLDQLHSQMHDAVFFHFGFEHNTPDCLYKLYLEFAQEAPAQHPLYRGYKWSPENARPGAVSTYAQVPDLSLATMLVRVQAVYGDAQVAQIALEIVSLIASHATPKGLLFVDVCDDRTSRVSFDINAYSAGLPMNAISAKLFRLSEYLGINSRELSALLSATQDHVIGHISGGTNQHGQPFLTVYHTRAA